MLLFAATTSVYSQTSPRSGIFGSTTPKSNHGMTFQTPSNTVHLNAQMGYGTGFFIPVKSPVTSVVNEVKIEAIKIYPNPTSSIVTLEFNKPVHRVRIFDIKGNIVFTIDQQTTKITQDMSALAAGLYRVVAFGIDENFVSTFFVTK